ncbi:sigma 54-interacting transcriptional regulator [Desulfobaculum bizertense]|uniref:sigma-54 interaction domain-containing protein n=1 Tax=Desulfobaculum bizertense TaxID=376490 RepID=UPI001F3980E2|nr:sigma 54-interacting transcriptional regulator [Desulfobaculum bizertense]UIJ37025.1 sigma 54-interacting transcriptional regulator [Desulfobaculum bizertense]
MSENVQQPDPLITKNIHGIFDVLSDGIYISDRFGKTLTVNQRYEKLTGLSKKELINRNVTELVNDGVYDTILNPKIVATGKSCTSIQVNKKGRRLVLTGYPIFDDAGDVNLVVTFARDITAIGDLRNQLAAEKRLVEQYHEKFKSITADNSLEPSVVLESPKMKELVTLLKRVAPTDATVLLLGETGVGKDVLARKTHEFSLRSSRPFFKVDCTTIPENLIESELFGYAPGAFSGAHSKGKIGFFEMAEKGTLFLDEIGELPLLMQGKLLRVLQDQELIRVGDTKVRKVDVRIIAATNRNLEEEVKSGRFRSDLFYRLKVTEANIPPLRERHEDVLPLAQMFIQRYSQKYRRNVALTPGAQEALRTHHWPGNVRELENMIQSLVVTSASDIVQPYDLPESVTRRRTQANADGNLEPCIALGDNPPPLREMVKDFERQLLQKAIETYGSVPKVAKKLKVDRSTIFRKLR